MKLSMMSGVAAGAFGAGLLSWPGKSYAYSQSPPLRKFIQPLPYFGSTAPAGYPKIPVATPYAFPSSDYYKIQMWQFRQKVHPDLPATLFWGYRDMTPNVTRQISTTNNYLGGGIIATKGRAVRVKFENVLPNAHPLPVDTSLMSMGPGVAVNRTVPHLHGGHVAWSSDGSPHSWWAPDGTHGDNWQDGDYWYPNDQSARLMWYHDHALAMTRLNVYAGLVSPYILIDPYETSLAGSGVIPSAQESIYLVIQDKTFKQAPDQWGNRGDLWYAAAYEPNQVSQTGRWDWGPLLTPPGGAAPLPYPSNVPEFFGDSALINGALFPFLEVQQKVYRFRILNGSQARFYNLQLYYEDAANPGEINALATPPVIVQIGTEGGLLPNPVYLNNPPRPIVLDGTGTAIVNDPTKYNLLLAPAERADILIDFSGVPIGSNLILYSDAPAPFPGGDDRNDYFTGNADLSPFGGALPTKAGFGPNTRTLMQFRVTSTAASSLPLPAPSYNFTMDPPLAATPGTDYTPGILPASGRFVVNKVLRTVPVAQVRSLTLNEDFDSFGRLLQTIGTTTSLSTNNQGINTYGLGYDAAATEVAANKTAEVWLIFNLSGDVHPIHLHLVNFQILWRANFDTATPNFNSWTSPRYPDANELGWKETVRVNPGEVAALLMYFDAPAPPNYIVNKTSTRPGLGTTGYEYVYHCHILEHEEHDMMRPLVVTP